MSPAPAVTRPRILLVDDSSDDAELVRRALSRGGVPSSITRVDNAAGFREALADRSWDLVIADYSQPSFGALAVLDVLRALEPELSCIVISGVAGEDRAVETMRAGARDFVSKDRLQRLAPAVQRELEEGQSRRERIQLHRDEHLRNERLRGAGTQLLDILRGTAFVTGRAHEVYRELAALVSRAVDVDRVSIWLFTGDHTRFSCVESFDRTDSQHTHGQVYAFDDNPGYFEALDRSRFVEAHDALAEHRVGAGAEPAVSSQLDAAIRVRGKMVGALCLDHAGDRRWWRSDEQVFVGSIADLVALVMEAQERRRAEVALSESDVRYRELWENALDGMFTLDPAGRITSVNVAGGRITGRDAAEMVGRDFLEFVAVRDRATMREVFQYVVRGERPGGDPVAFSVDRPEGTVSQVEASAQRIERNGELVEVLAIVRDVSQRRQLEAQLQQSQKMEAIGRLAGGVAHDFNNLLTAIIGYSQIAAIRPDVPAPAVMDLREITSAAHRAAALTRQLLAFSRRQVLEPRVLHLNGVVAGIEGLLRRLIGEDIALDTDLDPTLAPVLADPSQLEQVILNLAVNARDALPNGGRIVLRTRTVAAADRPLSMADPGPGPLVVLEVTDNGVGMDDETRLHVFEPFYTTKELGTGLGLSTVYGIVQQSGGSIAVDSERGRGSTFSVFLPVVTGSALEAVSTSVDIGPGGTETVLVVEDDDRVRSLACRVLGLAGYSVLEASEPDVALALTAESRAIDLLVTDLVLPVMRGGELYDRMRASRPLLKVLFMSGYRDGGSGHETLADPFLPKPFTPASLTGAVRAALDGHVPQTRVPAS